jgi:GDP-mannose 6-dehydrogenase
MNISIFGLGYVGGVTAACLGNDGHVIVGVDVQEAKVEAFNAGLSPIVEPCLDDLLRVARAKGHLKATTSAAAAIAETELSIVCVGTPSKVTGALDLSFVRAVVSEIGEAVRRKGQKHTLVLRSTMLPGSTQQIVRELLSDLTASSLLAVYYYPEFLREGTGVADFQHPSLIVVGTSDGRKPPQALMDTLFGGEAMVVDWPTAEMVKYACNAFHATKIAFANEMGRIGKQMGVDARAVMDLLCRDTKLNLSSYYLKPGNPFGGSCLPKDVRALTQEARTQGLSLPLLENLLPSNERHLQTLLGIITDSGQKEVCLLGLAFKPNTDDLREAPMVEVAQILLGRGFTIRIYDPALNLSALVGANKRLVDTRMPHLAALLCTDLGCALGDQSIVIAAQKCASLSELEQHLTVKHHVLDVNGWPELALLPSRYEGLCW